jgi:hypothetical protein
VFKCKVLTSIKTPIPPKKKKKKGNRERKKRINSEGNMITNLNYQFVLPASSFA